jgi:hypothetical protein
LRVGLVSGPILLPAIWAFTFISMALVLWFMLGSPLSSEGQFYRDRNWTASPVVPLHAQHRDLVLGNPPEMAWF